MKALVALLILLLIAAGGATGYFYLQNQHAREKIALLEDMNSELDFKVQNLEARNAMLAAQLKEEIAKISEQKEKELERLTEAHSQLVEELKQEIEQKEIKITQLADRLYVRMDDKILFPSGEAELTPEGLQVLQRVGNIIKKVEGKLVRVEGHTDNVPIHPRLQDEFPSNWELSTARATNVVKFLQDKVGIAPERLEAIGLAEYHPVASNKTKAGRSKNRRIEVMLVPPFTAEPVAQK